MENELTELTLNEEEDEILQIQLDSNMEREGGVSTTGVLPNSQYNLLPSHEKYDGKSVASTYKILNTLTQKRTAKKGFMVVKLDMSKAYNKVEWNFLKEIMVRMNFSTKWIKVIMQCVTTVSYSVVINGHIGEKFLVIRGLRQGSNKHGANLSENILREYRFCSSQCVNFDKSTVFFSKNISGEDKQLVVNLLRVRSLSEPERYLGLPNMVGRRKNESFQNLKDRFKKLIDNWSTRFLSQGRREVFIKAILQAVPTYTMACFLLPRSLCDDLENIIAKYWWKKGHGKRGIHWCT
ncbi:hypothetical protein J1N35_037190 [Gossypium stocksii]|uniref:Reverse transcriptase n=1 Tax=Gossypium stocksii TaxID=47602 RepID=A0A9D3UJP9_9ROSI|nr:hypothetical protein J1N35_037190 [Gossypium stocksii]